jgi:nitroreductase
MADQMGLFEVMYTCRAIRRLRRDPVPEELLVRLVEAGNQAPSGSNLQGLRWIIVRDAEQKRRLAALNKAAVEAYIGLQQATAPELPHQSRDKRQRMIDAVRWQADHLHEIPALVVACYQFPRPVTPGQAAQAAGSVWPGVQNFLLAARALGLGAAPTTLGLTNRDAVREILALPDTVEAFCLLPVGFPMGRFGPVTRLPVAETLCWDRWTEPAA